MRRCLAQLVAVAVAACVSTSLAHAQTAAEPALSPAPAPSPAPPAPSPAPPDAPLPYAQGTQPVTPAPPAPPLGVMSRRWAIGVDVGPESYAPKVEPQPDATSFGQLELAARYRVVAPIEVELAIHLGGSKDISEGGFYLGGRYRFLAEQALNIYGLLDLGVLAVAHKDASDQAKQGRGSLRLGVGGEYRWSWFALVAEFRLITVGKNADLPPSTITPEPVDYQLSRYQLAGASFALGANFYF